LADDNKKEEQDFRNSLDPDLQQKYAERKKKVAEEVIKEFDDRHTELELQKQYGIDEDQRHRSILNACIFPFTQDDIISKTGFAFLRASPLHELEVSNLDFLLYNQRSNLSIFGEAKSSVADESAIVSQTKKRIGIVQENILYVAQEYLGAKETKTEFVTGVPWSDRDKLIRGVLSHGGGIVVWETGPDSHDGKWRLKLSVPPKEVGSLVESMKHSDKKLASALLNGILTNNTFKSFFIESHTFAKLRTLITIDTGRQDSLFTFDDVYQFVKEELMNFDDPTIKEETTKILEIGIAIGFIKKEGDNKFKVAVRQKNAKDRETELKTRWINWELKFERDQEIDRQLKPIRDELLIEQSNRKKLTEFQN
jgi:hypothetical protein